jgi:hypothetical protein
VSQRTETSYKAEPQGKSAPYDEALLDHWGMVNGVVVQGKIMLLPGEICQPKHPNGCGGTEPAMVRVNMAEISRGRAPRVYPGERSEGSVMLVSSGYSSTPTGDLDTRRVAESPPIDLASVECIALTAMYSESKLCCKIHHLATAR